LDAEPGGNSLAALNMERESPVTRWGFFLRPPRGQRWCWRRRLAPAKVVLSAAKRHLSIDALKSLNDQPLVTSELDPTGHVFHVAITEAG
jgi:hypothetical protein